MGRITTALRVLNAFDWSRSHEGTLPPESVRAVDVPEAVFDDDAPALSLPSSTIRLLGLRPDGTRRSRRPDGPPRVTVYSHVRILVQDRDAIAQVTEVPDGSEVVLGRLPLLEMDLVPCPEEGTIIPNPAHDWRWELELYGSPAECDANPLPNSPNTH